MLSQRLQSAAAHVSQGAIVADIGSDHAYLAIDVCLRSIAEKAYACEISEGPLRQSIANIARYQMEGKVIPLLQDGLRSLPKDVSEVVIAGMGAHTIIGILQQSLSELPRLRKLILQPNNHADLLRTYVSKHRWMIEAEDVVKDGKYYQLMVVSTKPGKELTMQEIYFGPCLMQEKSSVFLSFYAMKEMKYQAILSNMDDQGEKVQVLADELEWIAAMKKGI